jgi:RNA recognition motif-containing protein
MKSSTFETPVDQPISVEPDSDTISEVDRESIRQQSDPDDAVTQHSLWNNSNSTLEYDMGLDNFLLSLSMSHNPRPPPPPQSLLQPLPLLNPQQPPAKSYEIFVGNLSFFCEEIDLLSLFSKFGNVEHCRIVRNDGRKRSLMYGFVCMSTELEAQSAANALQGSSFMGRAMKYV